MRIVKMTACCAALMSCFASSSCWSQERPSLTSMAASERGTKPATASAPGNPSRPTPSAESGLKPGTQLGFYDADRFDDLKHCSSCGATPAARFYFSDDYAVSPKTGGVGFDSRLRAFDDLKQWALARSGTPSGELPSLLWLGSPQVMKGTLSEKGDALTTASGAPVPVSLVPKIRTNLSYFDSSSRQYFAHREVVARGTLENGNFVARTLWPADFALSSPLQAKPLLSGEDVRSLVKANGGGAHSPFQARVLWQKTPGQALDVAGKPVLAFMLNGAQGDDDEAHGGHFAVATGVFGPHGEWNQWLVNNFYNLGSVSEKGIIASTLPMDAYLADLNSGQAWYRPSYMVVAVLKDGRGAQLYQEGIGRIFQHFYRQDFPYKHATANCTGLNIETFRTLGWNVPKRGPDNLLKAYVALPYMAIKDRSIASGKSAFDYLATEKTNLYPLVGFSTLTEDLIGRIANNKVAKSGLERQLADDLEAVVYVQIPQFPSSRAFGQAPVGSLDEYMKQAPENHADWKIVPVDPRPFPKELKDPEAPAPLQPPSEHAFLLEASVFGALTVGGGLLAVIRRRKGRSQ